MSNEEIGEMSRLHLRELIESSGLLAVALQESQEVAAEIRKTLKCAGNGEQSASIFVRKLHAMVFDGGAVIIEELTEARVRFARAMKALVLLSGEHDGSELAREDAKQFAKEFET